MFVKYEEYDIYLIDRLSSSPLPNIFRLQANFPFRNELVSLSFFFIKITFFFERVPRLWKKTLSTVVEVIFRHK